MHPSQDEETAVTLEELQERVVRLETFAKEMARLTEKLVNIGSKEARKRFVASDIRRALQELLREDF